MIKQPASPVNKHGIWCVRHVICFASTSQAQVLWLFIYQRAPRFFFIWNKCQMTNCFWLQRFGDWSAATHVSFLLGSHLQSKHKTLTLLFQPNVKYCKIHTQPPVWLLLICTQIKMFSCEYLCLIISSVMFRGLVHLWLLLILQTDNTEKLFCANHIPASARQKEHGKGT